MERIIHNIGSLHIGGSQAFIIGVLQHIDRTKYQFDFIVTPEERTGFYDDAERLGARIYVSPRYSGVNHLEYVSWWKNFFRKHPEYRIIHGHVRSTASIYLRIAKNHGLKTIAHSHSTSNGAGVTSRIKDLYQLPIRYTADYFFACSDDAGKWLFGKDIVSNKNYKCIPNGIDSRLFRFDGDIRNEMREKLQIENSFVVGNIGRLSLVKNHDFLIEIFKNLLVKEPSAKLLLVGDGEQKERLKQKCKDEGILDKVIFTGSQKDVHLYYQAMDVFVLTSKFEGLCIALIEAQHSGLRCIVSDCVVQEAIITETVKRLSLFDDVRVWIEAIIQPLSIEREQISKQASKNYKNIDDVATMLTQAYLEILAF